MKSIYLDIGNSSFKLAEFRAGRWKGIYTGPLHSSHDLFDTIKNTEGEKELMVASVRKDFKKQMDEKLSDIKIRYFKSSDIPSGLLQYNTPETLGVDRFLTCLGASAQSRKDVVVIDAGSACTIDLMSADNVFQGGVIMPGLSIIKTAMKQHLPELPEAEERLPESWPGKSTNECIQWGLYGGYASAILAFIRKYETENNVMDVFVTGGDARFIKRLVSKEMEINHREHLLFDGMREFAKIKRTLP